MRKIRLYKRIIVTLLKFLIDLCFYYDRIYRKKEEWALSSMYKHANDFNSCLKEIEEK